MNSRRDFLQTALFSAGAMAWMNRTPLFAETEKPPMRFIFMHRGNGLWPRVMVPTVFWLGISTGRLLQLPREDYLAVGFAGSQKTLMVGLVICVELGVLLIPMVLYHVAQLFVDTLFADYFRQRGQRDPELSADK